MHLVESEADIEALDLTSDKLLITNQTTMSQWDVHDLMELIKEKYPHVEYHQEICLATQVRQEAVSQQAGQADLTIVVGDPKSNNSNRLAQVSMEIAGTQAYRIGDLSELKLEWLQGVNTVAITAGASTPTPITKEVIRFLENYEPDDESTWKIERSVPLSKILPRVKTKK